MKRETRFKVFGRSVRSVGLLICTILSYSCSPLTLWEDGYTYRIPEQTDE